jgi:cobalt-zinc-cadmium efflux system outer membrane protein
MCEIGRSTFAMVLLSVGCTFAAPKPLRPVAEIAAAPPSAEALRAAVLALHNPLLADRPIDWSDGLDPDEAALLAAANNPELRAARAARGEAAAELVQAGLLPNPVFATDLAQPTSGPDSQSLVLSYGLSLSIDTQSLVTRSARVDAARANATSVDLGLAWQEWQVAQAARLEAVRVGRLRRRLDVARAEVEFLEETTGSLERALARGDASLPALGVQRAALEAARQVRRELETAEASSESTLLARLGMPPETQLAVSTAGAPQVTATLAELRAAVGECLARRLDLEALRAAYDGQEARLRQAVLEQLPAVTVGLARQRNESQIGFLGGFVTASLPVFDHAQARVALAEATRARLGSEFEARVIDARRELDALERALDIGRSQLSEVERSLPDLSQLEASERAAANRGDVDRTAYQAVRAALFDLRLTEESLAQAQAETAIGLELACGGPLALLEERS